MPGDSKTTRPINLEPLVHPKEKLYFGIAVVLTVLIYFGLAKIIFSEGAGAGTVVRYVLIFVFASFMMRGLFVGYVRGNGIRVSERQFPDLMLVLAAGRDLYHQDNTKEFGQQRETETGFFVSFAERIAAHPHLTK